MCPTRAQAQYLDRKRLADRGLVRFVDTLGLHLGVRVEARKKHAFGGLLVLRVERRDCTLKGTVAHQVFIYKQTRTGD